MDNQFNGEIMGQDYFLEEPAESELKGDVTAVKKFGLMAIIFGALHTFCLYRNTSGITYPFFMAGTLLLIAWTRRSEGLSIFRDKNGKIGLNIFYIISLMLLSVSKFTTANGTILTLDGFAIYLLVFSFLLHMCIDTNGWDIISQFIGILLASLSPITKLADPIVDGITWFKSRGKAVDYEKRRTMVAVFAGICIAMPLLLIVIQLLASADAIFEDVLEKMTGVFKLPDNILDIFGMAFMFVVTFWLFYTVAKVLSAEKVKVNNKNCGYNAVTAITFSSLLCLVYLLFSVIQIVFLFMGNMTLPEKYTYAEYAHEGFYQLLAVSVMNFVIVTLCQKLFAESKVLKVILVVIGFCTYIMITSSAFRMFMYIEAYNLTFLRVFVLWFLAVLAICLAYLLVSLFDKSFPVYKISMVTITVMYIVFAFAHPDYFIAKYDIAKMGTGEGVPQISGDFEEYGNSMARYLTWEISEDAVPAYVGHPTLLAKYSTDYYGRGGVPLTEKYKEIRKFNLARYRAYKLCSPYHQEKESSN
ncbi:DUF4153 domain-containing protein [Butyrivibrio sp. VCD2006]|uniref:DUF4153 domain-containing protein n=1 Tax=Butyrivibrio sp. VCD2006 TaxID=1280664 RepID=UPI000412F5ED|nr:DUF4173 domain-containing protein [Butyrivibrio sp. VCD2006]